MNKKEKPAYLQKPQALPTTRAYSLEDCDCQYCLYYAGTELVCALDDCICAEEWREAFALGDDDIP